MIFRKALCNRGFTLVELMMTLVVSAIILAALFSTYLTQQRSQSAQDQVAEVQQNIRAGFGMMISEMRTAGFDPRGTANAGIITATRGRFQFTRDINAPVAPDFIPGDGDVIDTNENITYGFSVLNDATQDGVADAGFAPLGRSDLVAGATFEPIAENIQAIEFVYLVGNAMTPTMTPTAAERGDIRAITISVLARVGDPDPNFTNTLTYLPASVSLYNTANPPLPTTANWGGPNNDNFRRRLYVTTVKLRNMAL